MHLKVLAVGLLACVACASAEKTLNNWSDLEDLVSKVSDTISSRAKRDFPYNYDASAQYSNEAAQYTPDAAAVNTPIADERQDGAGTDIVFQFPQTSVPELIVNLAPVRLLCFPSCSHTIGIVYLERTQLENVILSLNHNSVFQTLVS